MKLLDITPNSSSPQTVRNVLDEVTKTKNREIMIIGTKAGEALALTVQSNQDDTLLKALFTTLKNSAKKQLSGSRGGIFVVELHGLEGEQLLSIVTQDKDFNSQQPAALRIGASKFLSSNDRDHVVGVGFISNSGILPKHNTFIDTGGAAYYFPKPESPF